MMRGQRSCGSRQVGPACLFETEQTPQQSAKQSHEHRRWLRLSLSQARRANSQATSAGFHLAQFCLISSGIITAMIQCSVWEQHILSSLSFVPQADLPWGYSRDQHGGPAPFNKCKATWFHRANVWRHFFHVKISFVTKGPWTFFFFLWIGPL